MTEIELNCTAYKDIVPIHFHNPLSFRLQIEEFHSLPDGGTAVISQQKLRTFMFKISSSGTGRRESKKVVPKGGVGPLFGYPAVRLI